MAPEEKYLFDNAPILVNETGDFNPGMVELFGNLYGLIVYGLQYDRCCILN